MEENRAPYCHQDDFSLDKLQNISDYSGLKSIENNPLDYQQLFSLFKGE